MRLGTINQAEMTKKRSGMRLPLPAARTRIITLLEELKLGEDSGAA
jgi:hypothetical protein